jgi:hypothetical protein
MDKATQLVFLAHGALTKVIFPLKTKVREDGNTEISIDFENPRPDMEHCILIRDALGEFIDQYQDD